jgi:hypothetical protein
MSVALASLVMVIMTERERAPERWASPRSAYGWLS